jgi:C-terminal processing protease CtpA/Prc
MLRWKRSSVPIVTAGLALMCAFELALAQTKQSGPQIWQKTFDVVWKTVNDKYFDPQFGGVDWRGVRERYAPRVATVKSDTELYDLLGRMLAEIPTSHLSLLEVATLETQMARSVVATGLALRDVDNQVLITRVIEGSSASNAGLHPGFVLTTLDGVPVATARGAETTLARENRQHRLTILDDTGTAREFLVSHRLPPADKLESEEIITSRRYVFVDSRRLADGIGYVHFTNFIEPLKKKLLGVFDAMRDAPGIVIDLRGNSGGDTELGLAMAGKLLQRETLLAITRTRKGEEDYYRAKPQKNPYPGPVVILLDEESGSESEQVSAGLRDVGRVVIVGKISRGADLDATFRQLPMDSIFLLYPIGQPCTTKGVIIEGRGVIPDVEVNLTRAELLKGRDAQLEAAVDYIRKRK